VAYLARIARPALLSFPRFAREQGIAHLLMPPTFAVKSGCRIALSGEGDNTDA
jgi:hypothetical protein